MQVSCICSVDGRLAPFQIDSGSTFSQITPELAPQRVPRLGLGSADCLGRRLWFPTCSIALAPVGADGTVLVFGDGATVQAAIPRARVQIGTVGLLGLLELQRWCAQLSFAPYGGCSCSVVLAAPSAEQAHFHEEDETVTLEDAMQAAEVLNSGALAAEEAVSDRHPHRVDAAKVLEMSRPRTYSPWLPARSSAVGKRLRQAATTTRLASQAVLFGTADALVSQTMPPPLLPAPALFAEWPEVFFGTADALVSETVPPPLLPGP